MIKGGDSGTALVPGKPAESPLLQAAAHQSADTSMPPVDNKVNAVNLTPGELGLLSLWIEQGAYAEAAKKAAEEKAKPRDVTVPVYSHPVVVTVLPAPKPEEKK